MLPIYFAPLQGFTDHIYRTAHYAICGGVKAYYTPFLRFERGGIRPKELRDIDPQFNMDIPIIPQVIAGNAEETALLCDKVQSLGYARIDINMGCPFPMQTRQGRGAGLLPHPDTIESILNEISHRSGCSFSIKMRLGLSNPDDYLTLLPLLNNAPLASITVHPRTASQMYKGQLDAQRFRDFLHQSAHPVIYNGEITSVAQIESLENEYPNLGGIMIGRGLLSTPTLATDYQRHCSGIAPLAEDECISTFWDIHDQIFHHALTHLQGDSQVLSHMQALWQYPSTHISRKMVKSLSKCGNVKNYTILVEKAKETSLNASKGA